MKRLHVHVSVSDIDASIGFYQGLFGAAPTVRKADYAKWMLEDPCVNFALSSRGSRTGLDHLGIQVETDEELTEVRERLDIASLPVEAQTGAACCYARSDKYWTTDPEGIAWESFRTLASIPTFNNDAQGGESACCMPRHERKGEEA
ncbi:MAG TPA: ArsI/CadI family heavy metal resistance metalloenzyme [Gammaproteobacteria bacterium]|nr:ArsI/CadI family heavy metal resistance metalloenzyme [Gammaproteobacteria bacterium]